MYFVERNNIDIVVTGPAGFKKGIDPRAIGVVLRCNESETAQPYTLKCADMTDAELVAVALEIDSYPT